MVRYLSYPSLPKTYCFKYTPGKFTSLTDYLDYLIDTWTRSYVPVNVESRSTGLLCSIRNSFVTSRVRDECETEASKKQQTGCVTSYKL